MNLFKVYGSEIHLYQMGKAYKGHFICPIEVEGQEGYKVAIFGPDGDREHPPGISEGFYPHPAAAFSAAKQYVDLTRTYWVGELLSAER